MDISSNKKLKHPEIAHRLKAIRKTQKKSQQYIADLLGIGVPKMINIENSRDEYDQSDIDVLVKDLGVEGVPLTDEQVAYSMKRIAHLSLALASGNFVEAKATLEEQAPALHLKDTDLELVLLYKLNNVDYLLSQGEVEQAKQEMKALSKKYKDMDDRHRYHYYHNEGRILFRSLDYKKGIEVFKKAHGIAENNKDFNSIFTYRAASNIGYGYSELNYPNAAITFLEKATKGNFESNGLNAFYFFANKVLGSNYAKIGMIKRAEKLIYKALDYSESVGNEFYIASSHYDLGKIYTYSEDWDKGKEHFEKARTLFEKGSEYYMWSSYNKAECMIGNREFKSAEKLMEEVETLYIDNEKAKNRLEWLKSMHSISKGITQDKEEDVQYLLNEAIPNLLENHFILEAIKTYELLAEHFERTVQRMKAGEMYKEVNKLRKRLNADI
ncbi:MAG: hypothetical protein FWC69_06565 [Defluviitaleaceae bacterium]|nr:hypothetical protein [Defluviitaleaceae bacterium]